MKNKIKRRTVLKSLAAASVLSQAPLFGYKSAFAANNTLVYGSAGTVTSSWDPTSHTVAPQIVMEGFTFSKLTNCPMTTDNPSEILPDLATDWKVIDQYNLEYKLREGVTFHNGQPFSAKDVKATMEYGCNPERPASAWYPGKVRVDIVDDYTVRLNTEEFGYSASNFWFVSSFLPMLCAEDVANPDKLKQSPNGTGAFAYNKTDGDRIILKAFDNYHFGRPQIDELVYAYVPDANSRALGLMNGELDLVERLEPEQYFTLKEKDGIVTDLSPTSENMYMHFRCNKAPFDDVRMRQAVAHAIDREQVLAVADVAGFASNSHLNPVKFGYTDVPNYPEYNPAKCQELMAAAGYPNGKGLPELEYISSVGFYPKTREYNELITAMLNEQGIPAKLTLLEPAAWEERIYNHELGHMVHVGWITGSPEPDLVLRPNYYSDYSFIGGFNDPEMDATLNRERDAASPEEKLDRLQNEVLPMLADKVPSVSLFSANFMRAHTSRLSGIKFYPNGPYDLSKATLS